MTQSRLQALSESLQVSQKQLQQVSLTEAQRAEEQRQREVGHVFDFMADYQGIESAASDLGEDRLIDERASRDAPEAVVDLDMLEREGRGRGSNVGAGLRLEEPIRKPPGTVPILRSPRSKMGLSPSLRSFC